MESGYMESGYIISNKKQRQEQENITGVHRDAKSTPANGPHPTPHTRPSANKDK